MRSSLRRLLVVTLVMFEGRIGSGGGVRVISMDDHQ